MSLLRAALDDAFAGQGGAVLLVGEPGIGKTRMAENSANRLQAVTPLSCGAVATKVAARLRFGPGSKSCAPLFAAAIRLLLAELQAAATDIARLVPELRERWPSELPALPLDDEQARFRLFDSVTTFLTRVAHTNPLC